MHLTMLETSQILINHPIIGEDDDYKIKYLNILEYFLNKYSKDDLWAQQTFQLYTKYLLSCKYQYKYSDATSDNVLNDSFFIKTFTFNYCIDKNIYGSSRYLFGGGSSVFGRIKFFPYRYCLLMDCIFICALRDKTKGQKILLELSSNYGEKYKNNFRRIFDFIYEGSVFPGNVVDKEVLKMQDFWQKNRRFFEKQPIKVIVTANMSAGKSTLLNALMGKKINKTQNDACTAKVHYILNKPYEDGFCYKLDPLLNLDADEKTIIEDNPNSKSPEIVVGTFFRFYRKEPRRIWFIDTPGVNSSMNSGHKIEAEKTISKTDADMLIYVMNGENIGTYDDKTHLSFVQKNYHGKILFVVNKLDRFRKNEDSVPETLKAVSAELEEMGFNSPIVVPVSSYAAYLAKLNIYGEYIDEDNMDELNRMIRKIKNPEYHFDSYFPEWLQHPVQSQENNDNYKLLLHSGVLQIENLIYSL